MKNRWPDIDRMIGILIGYWNSVCRLYNEEKETAVHIIFKYIAGDVDKLVNYLTNHTGVIELSNPNMLQCKGNLNPHVPLYQFSIYQLTDEWKKSRMSRLKDGWKPYFSSATYLPKIDQKSLRVLSVTIFISQIF